MLIRGTKPNNIKNAQNVNHSRKPYGTWKCHKCNQIFETRAKLISHNHEFHPCEEGTSWNKGLTKYTDARIAKYVNTCKARHRYKPYSKGRHLSLEVRKKTSETLKAYYKQHPDKVPYVLNHSSKESYPEKYFKQAFLNESFPKFEQDKYVIGYFLDFAFVVQKKFVEIDGEQHYVHQKIVEHDKIRTSKLNETEWKCVCRIRWSKFKKLTHQQRHSFLIGLKKKILES